MILAKLYYHLVAILKMIYFRAVYREQLQFGKGVTFRSRFNIDIDSEFQGRILIGNRCFFNRDCTLSSQGMLTVGNDCLFGENVKIYDHNHKFYSSELIRKQGYSVGEIYIGDNCWVGSNVTFLKGACVGEGCVIGAGCIIKFTIPPYTIVSVDQDLHFAPIQYEMRGKYVNKIRS